MLEKGRILGAMGLAAIAALGLALATVFAVLAFDRGDIVYGIAAVLALACGVAFGTAVFIVAAGKRSP